LARWACRCANLARKCLDWRCLERQGKAAREGWLGQSAQKRPGALQAYQFGATLGAGSQMRFYRSAFLRA
jgi:hypothetical protein